MVTLQEATKDNIHEVWEMQIKAFEDLLEKYQDFDMSPGAEPFENILAKFNQPWTKYYFILDGDQKIGCVRIIDKKDGSRRRVSPIWIMAEHRNKGYAQQAFDEIEELYGPDNWSLDTILQEEGNVHLYEKVVYHQTGEIEHIKDGMDITFFEKN